MLHHSSHQLLLGCIGSALLLILVGFPAAPAGAQVPSVGSGRCVANCGTPSRPSTPSFRSGPSYNDDDDDSPPVRRGPSPQDQRGAAATALNNKGVKCANAGDYLCAINYYEQALRINPNNSVARQNLARARAGLLNREGHKHFKAGNYPDAIESYRRAVILIPDKFTIDKNAVRSSLLNAQAWMAYNAYNYQQAIAFWTKRLQYVQSDNTRTTTLGNIANAQGRGAFADKNYHAALFFFKQGLQYLPNSSKRASELIAACEGHIAGLAGDYVGAVAKLEKALRYNHDLPPTSSSSVTLRREKDRETWQMALSSFQQRLDQKKLAEQGSAEQKLAAERAAEQRKAVEQRQPSDSSVVDLRDRKTDKVDLRIVSGGGTSTVNSPTNSKVQEPPTANSGLAQQPITDSGPAVSVSGGTGVTGSSGQQNAGSQNAPGSAATSTVCGPGASGAYGSMGCINPGGVGGSGGPNNPGTLTGVTPSTGTVNTAALPANPNSPATGQQSSGAYSATITPPPPPPPPLNPPLPPATTRVYGSPSGASSSDETEKICPWWGTKVFAPDKLCPPRPNVTEFVEDTSNPGRNVTIADQLAGLAKCIGEQAGRNIDGVVKNCPGTGPRVQQSPGIKVSAVMAWADEHKKLTALLEKLKRLRMARQEALLQNDLNDLYYQSRKFDAIDSKLGSKSAEDKNNNREWRDAHQALETSKEKLKENVERAVEIVVRLEGDTGSTGTERSIENLPPGLRETNQ